MTNDRLNILFLGLSLSSSWGNGHATTFRALMQGLHALGQRLTFLERDMPWYAGHRDLPDPDFCDLIFYECIEDLRSRHHDRIRNADVVIVGSFVPEGVAAIDTVAEISTGVLCFYDIDTPVTLTKLASGDQEYIACRQVPLFNIYFSFTGGPTLGRLRNQFHARHAAPLYCSVDETRYAPTGEPLTWDLGYLGTYSPDRQPSLQRLLLDVAERLPDRRFVVAGPQYPASIRWPENVERIEHLPPSQHASFYSRQRFTLNITRADMMAAGWSPSVRLFEAAACACPAVSDPWSGLEDFFLAGQSIQVARTTQDVCAILTGMNEHRRLELADNARRIALHAHTGKARARHLLDSLAGVGESGNSTGIQAA